jgi:hypothetical protein
LPKLLLSADGNVGLLLSTDGNVGFEIISAFVVFVYSTIWICNIYVAYSSRQMSCVFLCGMIWYLSFGIATIYWIFFHIFWDLRLLFADKQRSRHSVVECRLLDRFVTKSFLGRFFKSQGGKTNWGTRRLSHEGREERILFRGHHTIPRCTMHYAGVRCPVIHIEPRHHIRRQACHFKT